MLSGYKEKKLAMCGIKISYQVVMTENYRKVMSICY